MSRDTLLSLIDLDPEQPRKAIDETGIAELAQSMAENGLIQPIMLRPVADRFVIVHGERRCRAAQALGWETIAAEVRDVSPDEARWIALVENIQRADLSPIEEARAYQERLASGGTQEALAQRVGKSRSYVAQKLRLLHLPADVQFVLAAGSLTEGHGRQLLRLKDEQQQSELGKRAAAEGWTVQRVALEVDAVLEPPREAAPTTPAELVIWRFWREGGIPGHDPYPEEMYPEDWAPPVAVERLPISEIGDLPYDCRSGGRDLAYAQWLAEIFITLPPIAVFRVDGRYILADGKYRLMAAQLLGLAEIECRIYEKSYNGADLLGMSEVEDYGILQNAHQDALQFTNADLQRQLNRLFPGGDPLGAIHKGISDLQAALEKPQTLEEIIKARDDAFGLQQEAALYKLRCEREAGRLFAILDKATAGTKSRRCDGEEAV